MTEGVSLLGMIEVPAVIVLAQRPGPATGLPTRTAQGDLSLALHAGHGFFPRILLAPRNVSDGFGITASAFDLAERFQIPVFVLTDQHLQDAQCACDPFPIEGLPKTRHVLSVEQLADFKTYLRYEQTESGVSPMAFPGWSRHVVVVDSDEHDEEGHLTESADTAKRMAEKRIRKAKTVEEAAWPLEVEGEAEGCPLIVSFGSTYETLTEARKELENKGRKTAHLHLRMLWPLPERALSDLVARASRLIVVENSAGVELAGLLRAVALRKPDDLIRRMDGRPLEVDELVSKLGEVLP
jgi:2-oxoglutarate/2-oxoacid ferredoxin oxidoreductase subunit alpha